MASEDWLRDPLYRLGAEANLGSPKGAGVGMKLIMDGCVLKLWANPPDADIMGE